MIAYDLIMTTTEEKPITVEVIDLKTAETVTAGLVTHIPPSGSALTITATAETPYLNFLLGPFSVPGRHFVKVQAIGSAGSKPEVVYDITVRDI